MSPATMLDTDLVVSGGGSHGLTQVATIRALSRRLRYRRVGGASIGAIIASGLALGLTPDFMVGVFKKLLTRGQPGNPGSSLEDWKFPGPLKPLGILHGRGGMMRGQVLRGALTDAFGDAKMGDVKLPLRIKVGSLAKRRTETVYSDAEIHKKLRLVDVCMCSAAVPGLIDNQQLDPLDTMGPGASTALYCDGGTGNNVPRAMWDDVGEFHSRPTTVVRFLDSEKVVPAVSPTEKLNAYWNIARDAAEAERSSKPPELVWDVPIITAGSALDFSLTLEECERRVQAGDEAGKRWLASSEASPWPVLA